MKSIVLTGGGTAGHCVPCLALLPKLKKNFDNVYYIGSKTGIEKQLVEKLNLPYYSIPSTKLVRKITVKNLTIPFVFLDAVKKAEKLLTELNPDVIFSKGGYVALPVVISAHKLGIPVVTHESDFTLGLANKVASKYCEYILTSFIETAEKIDNGIYTGSPLREELFNGKKEFLDKCNFAVKKPILLILGGSLGSKAINSVVRESLTELLKTFNVIHICGKGNKSLTKKDGYKQFEFVDNMQDVYLACDVAVSRAGANATFELYALAIPTLLIPLPKASSRGDQIQNAEYYKKLGAFDILYQEKLTRESFLYSVTELYKNRYDYKNRMTSNPLPDANTKIVNILKKLTE